MANIIKAISTNIPRSSVISTLSEIMKELKNLVYLWNGRDKVKWNQNDRL